ncbi:serine/threonine-protein kinase 17A-like [Sinocyclocheilus rhinocerous]|uniref:serine/threonine-protein kinase 17A-like n=1 Tax=Sinocyclocheilus rhinocerous TaxID=307959 RepID=UPI0007B8646A|nr:PREDICTED: serine/threonine-protein kinase 17A-like [Sinocyclocheilus rhinocerous]
MIPECPRTTEPRSRIRCESGQNRSGLLREIRTAVRSEPFTERYDVIPGKELGRGKFAVVRKCVEKSTGKTYAAKYMRKRRKGQDCRTEILHEIGVLELAAACPRVVNLHQVYETACEMVLLLEYALNPYKYVKAFALWHWDIMQILLWKSNREGYSGALGRFEGGDVVLDGGLAGMIEDLFMLFLQLGVHYVSALSTSFLSFHLPPGEGYFGALGRFEGGDVVLDGAVSSYTVGDCSDCSSCGVRSEPKWRLMLDREECTSSIRGAFHSILMIYSDWLSVLLSFDCEELLEIDRWLKASPFCLISNVNVIQKNKLHMCNRGKAVERVWHRWTLITRVSKGQQTEEPLKAHVLQLSIGVLAYVMLTGISPFLGDDKQETFLNISQINISYTEEELQHLDRAAIHFIKSLLIKEPESRATAEDCLKHQWLQPEEACLESVSEPVGPADEDEEEEELIVMAAYTLGQCRQSSDEPSLTPDQKAISKRFKFEEPFSARPGEFIY